MLKKSLIVAVVLCFGIATCSSVNAEPLPFGCYVTDEERNQYDPPPACYVIQETLFSYLTPANTSLQGLVNAYGDVLASFIKLGYDTDVGLSQCDAAYKRQKRLANRLRAACGFRCKNIK